MNRVSKIITLIIVIAVLVCHTAVFALDDDLIFTGFFECKGKVYFCDPSTETVVLKNLEYSGIGDAQLRTDIRYLIEYNEIPIFMKGISAVDRGKIDAETVNCEYGDADVRVVIAKNGRGYKVVSMLCGIK